ncbi:AI-2E family transporter [Oceanobacillus halotolerans]|uniref:AI-2E family transporter n=1 Tax=Oceanobacillus halotolerans TaxID=2663380 RepID=UPI0013D8EDFA|nr:AI-2E family transporter [Oceanobacillus halotolerans]
MMDKKTPLTFLYWILLGIFLFLFLYLVAKLSPIYGAFFSFIWSLMAPFLISCLIAYFLYPIVTKIQRLNIPRSLAILFIYVLFFGGISYLIYRVYPTIVHQLHDLNEQLPELLEMYKGFVYQLYEYTAFLPETVHDKMDQLIYDIEASVDEIIGNIVGGVTKVFDMIVLLTVIPVLVFYFLKDYQKIKQYIKTWIPSKYQSQTSSLVHKIDESLGGYIRGLLLVSFFVGVISFIAFYFLQIPYALVLGVVMGLTNIIPYFGPIIGAIPVVAITMTVSTKLVIIAIIVIFVIQLVEGNFLSPYIVGKSVETHPIAIIFALLLGGQIGGVIGMIVAVPLLTIMKVIVSHILTIRQMD